MSDLFTDLISPPTALDFGASDLIAAPAGLSVQMQTLAQGYIDARKRAGYAWLDMGRFLSEARAEAKYGEWSVFLEATNTSEDWAKRLIAIYTQSLQNRVFADAMRTNFLSVATGYELISAPPDVQDRLLNGDTPPTVKQIREEKREVANPAPSPTFDPPPATPDLPPEFAIVQRRLAAHGVALSTHMHGKSLAFVTKKGEMTGIVMPVWSDVLTKLERLEGQAAAAPAQPYPLPDPAHVERLEAQIEADRIPEARMEIAPVSDRQAHLLKEARDAGRIERARTLIGNGEHAAARTVLDQIEVSTRAADQLRSTIPAGRQIILALHPDDCAALLREARMFSGSELTKQLPAIGQVLVLLVEAIKGGV